MNFVTRIILDTVRDEETTFWMLVQILLECLKLLFSYSKFLMCATFDFLLRLKLHATGARV